MHRRPSRAATSSSCARPGKGKGDAVFARASTAARGDVLMILDADLTMPPEQLPKFWQAIASGKGEFVNGSRLVYPMEHEAMQLPQSDRQHAFSIAVHLAAQPALHRHAVRHQGAVAAPITSGSRADRGYFGDFDPFGDFDLIFGAAKLNLQAASRCRSAIAARTMARRRSRASATACCCSRWWSSPSSALRRFSDHASHRREKEHIFVAAAAQAFSQYRLRRAEAGQPVGPIAEAG